MEKKRIPLIDSHAHLDLAVFDSERTDMIRRSIEGIFPEIHGKTPETGDYSFFVQGAVLPGITAESSRNLVRLAQNDPTFLFPGVGIHPNDVVDATPKIGNRSRNWRPILPSSRSGRPDSIFIGTIPRSRIRSNI